jgi:hypothetical protein
VNATGDGQQRVDRRVEWGQRVDCADDAPSGAAIAGPVDHRLDGIASAANVSRRAPSSIPRSVRRSPARATPAPSSATRPASRHWSLEKIGRATTGPPRLSAPSTDPQPPWQTTAAACLMTAPWAIQGSTWTSGGSGPSPRLGLLSNRDEDPSGNPSYGFDRRAVDAGEIGAPVVGPAMARRKRAFAPRVGGSYAPPEA